LPERCGSRYFDAGALSHAELGEQRARERAVDDEREHREPADVEEQLLAVIFIAELVGEVMVLVLAFLLDRDAERESDRAAQAAPRDDEPVALRDGRVLIH